VCIADCGDLFICRAYRDMDFAGRRLDQYRER
jgi:hypothetical protein